MQPNHNNTTLKVMIATRYHLGTKEFCDAQTYGTPRMERVTMPWGYIDAAGAVHYYVHDYQGNVRVVADGADNVEQATDYYPYGMPIATSFGPILSTSLILQVRK